MSQITRVSSPRKLSHIALDLMVRLLVISVWLSVFIFGLYILIFYALTLFKGDFSNWNKVLPNLYNQDNITATISIGIHFIAGGIIMMLGCIQMMSSVRDKYPKVHRWSGRVYGLASIAAAIGGTAFICFHGTTGGKLMDVGFGFYGLCMFIAAIFTIKFAMQKQFQKHRAWGIRLFALAVGSWLYRMEYGFWFILADGYGHTQDFQGPFDYVMNFFFYIPNLIIAEIIIGNFLLTQKPVIKILATVILFLATLFIAVGTFFFSKHLWVPEIMTLFS